MEGETPFWQELLLNSIGPLVTVVIGSLIVGTFAASITRSAQDRRTETDLGVGDPWEPGVHIFSVSVNISKSGGLVVGSATTIATAVIDERVPKVDFTQPGVAVEWIKAMEMERG
jgi:hypothetical protein